MKLNVDDLIEQGLVKKKTYTEGPYKGLSVLKYTKRVFYKNLWHLDDRLLECRGTVVDEDDNVVVLPFRKVFNLHENGVEVDPDKQVIAVRKVNGFMAAVTYTDKYGLIISTTGSLDSKYVDIARKHIEKLNLRKVIDGVTYLFEICDEKDPHIVDERCGAYLIGARMLPTQGLFTEVMLDWLAHRFECYRPKWEQVEANSVISASKTTNHEGYMIIDPITNQHICKIKSTHYLTKKFLMRMSAQKIEAMYSDKNKFKETIDEEYYGVVDYITENFVQDDWQTLSEQERREYLEEYFNAE